MSQQQFPGPYPPPPYYPPQPSPKRDNKALWVVLGSIMAFVLLLCALAYGFGSMMVSKENQAVSKMESIASRITPADDWTERGLIKPKVDPGCLPIDTTCHRWQQSWSTSGDVSLSDIESQLGIPLNASSGNCLAGEEDGVRVKVCAFNDKEIPQFNLFLED